MTAAIARARTVVMAGRMAVLLMVAAAPMARAAGIPDRPRVPLAQVLGIAPGTTEARAHHLLARLGERLEEAEADDQAGAGLERELWRLRDTRYAWVELAVDRRHRVRAIQASLRAGGPGLRYAEVGDLATARRLGYTILEWSVPATPAHLGRRVTARGTDPTFATTVAITAVD